MPRQTYRRRRKLIKPRLQLKLIVTFMGLVGLSLMLQFVLFTDRLTNMALELPNDGLLLLERTNSLLFDVLGVSFLLFLPLTFLVGVITTFRIAGPLYRFQAFLEQIERGERPRDFHLRDGDELHDLAALLNRATAPLRENEGDASGVTQSEEEPHAANGSEPGARNAA